MNVKIERNGSVATVVLNRPETANAVDGPTAEALHDAFVELDADDGVLACVLWGSGGTFCSGADLGAFGTNRMNRLEVDGPAPMGPTRLGMSKPVIAAIEGYAVAGGLELALWCDLRVAAETASFGVFCRRWGVPLIDGGTVRLPRIVGHGHAMDMILTGREVSSHEASTMGLVNRVVTDGTARVAGEALAADIAGLPQTCLKSDRESMVDGSGDSLGAAMRREFELGMETIVSGGAFNGARRFVDGEGRHGR